jgi:CheY-like chemotaxis protein
MSKILIVDDDPDILKLLRFKLSQETSCSPPAAVTTP